MEVVALPPEEAAFGRAPVVGPVPGAFVEAAGKARRTEPDRRAGDFCIDHFARVPAPGATEHLLVEHRSANEHGGATSLNERERGRRDGTGNGLAGRHDERGVAITGKVRHASDVERLHLEAARLQRGDDHAVRLAVLSGNRVVEHRDER